MLLFSRFPLGMDVISLTFILIVNFAYRLHQAVDWVGREMGPVCFFDELWYRYNAESLFAGSAYFTFHYPPLYPLVLAPSFASGDDWHFWMLAVNAALSSLLLVPVWLLARRFLPPLPSLLAVGLTAFLPYLWVYPRMIMSENLFAPLLVCSVYALLTLQRRQFGRSFLFGVLLAGCLATRHIAAPVTVFFLGWWWWKTQRRILPRRSSVPTLTGAMAGLTVILIPWLLYGFFWGASPIQTLLGLDIPRAVAKNLRPEMLPFWIGAYSAYLLIVSAPWLPWILLRFRSGRQALREERHLAFLTLGATLLIVAASVHHSWSVLYNYPDPQRVLGRYLFPVLPLILCLGLVSLYRSCSRLRLRQGVCLVSAAVSLALLFSAREFLIPGGLTDMPGYFAGSFINSPDTLPLVFRDRWATGIFFAFPVVPLVVLLLRKVLPTRPSALVTVGVLTFTGYWISGSLAAEKLEQGGKIGVHANKLSEIAQELGAGPDSAVGVVTDIPLLVRAPSRLRRPLLFLGFSDHTVVTSEVDCLVETSDLILSLTSKEIQEVPRGGQTAVYQLDGRRFHVSGRVNHDSTDRPCILSFGPQRALVGRAFHPDSEGRSSMWLKGRNLTESTRVELEGHRIKPKLTSSDVVTFTVPDDVIASPGEKPLLLVDEETGLSSDLVHFVVLP